MKRFLFLVFAVTLMVFFSYNVFAEDEGPLPFSERTGFGPVETNPMQVHAAANGRGSVQTAIVKQGSASQENRVNNDDCPFCDPNVGINDSTDVDAVKAIGPDGKPVKSSR